MNQLHWQEVEAVLAEVIDLPAEKRAARITELCGNRKIRKEVESLLSAHDSAASFLEVNTQSPIEGRGISFEGKEFGPYRVLEMLGAGGMGTVYRGNRTDGHFQKEVAIKVVPAALHSLELRRRLATEQQILAGLEHPNIARLLDAGISGEGIPYFVMEYVAGTPVDKYCETKQLSLHERLRLFQSLCSAVQYAHQHLIVHRDLKPGNILVTDDGIPKLLDFGIAKILDPWIPGAPDATLSLIRPMTPAYASPEQARGEDITTATDVYSLGVVLYELITGQQPYSVTAVPLSEAIRTISESDPVRPSILVRSRSGANRKLPHADLYSELDAIVAKAMRKDPRQRYSSAVELSSDIGRALSGQPVLAHRGSLRYRAKKFVGRHRFGVGLTAVATVLTISFAITMALQARRIARERDRANREAEASKRVAEFMAGMFKVSDPSESHGERVTAREILDSAARDVDRGLANDPQLQARMMHVIGRSYMYLGIYPRAQSLFERGIQAGHSANGPENREALNTMHDLAWTLLQQGRLAEAEAMERKLLELQLRALGGEDPDTLATMSELGFTLCQERTNCAEGIRLNSEVLEKQKRILGPEAHYTLVTMDNLAVLYAENREPSEAEALERQTLAIHLRVDGPENLSTINSMINLADCERDLGRDEEAKRLFLEALDVEERVLGPNQPETAATRYDLATIFVREGQMDKALALLRQAIDHGLPPLIAQGMRQDAYLKPLHDDPRFAALLAVLEQRTSVPDSRNKTHP